MHRFRGNIMSRAVSRALDELGDVKPDAVILFNRSSSVIADREFEKTIKDDADFFPSPSLFVYTLPNICAGEIAIRYNIQAETSFYILRERNEELMRKIVECSTPRGKTVLYGWIDCPDTDNINVEFKIWKN